MPYLENSLKLTNEFYLRNVLAVAKDLLGKILLVSRNGEMYSGIIVETEAYDGKIDEASHSFKGKTPSNCTMFDEGGKLYVYFTYGMHYCANVVTGRVDDPCAVLLRAVEPLSGLKKMALNRFGSANYSRAQLLNLTSGPAKLTQAMGINTFDNGRDLSGDEICILNAPAVPEDKITITTRIGITKSIDLPWRFYIARNPFVSRK